MTSNKARTIAATTVALAAVVAAGASASAVSAAKGPPTPKASHFGKQSSLITNTWFPLARGSVYIYDGQKDGKLARDVMTVTRRTKNIAGIRAAVVSDRLLLNGVLAERTTDWYAQDKVTSTEGSFLNGRDGANGGIFMPANPQVGQSFQQESFKGQAEDHFRILDLAATISTPAVSSNNAMLTEETTPLEPGIVDHKYYVQGIGTVKEQQVAGAPPGQGEVGTLVSFTPGR